MLQTMLQKIFILQIFADFTGDSTASSGMSVEMKTFYEKKVLQNAEPELVHDRFAEKFTIPAHAGKTIEFRRVAPLKKNLKALQEGVTPVKSNLQATAITATIAQYGNYIENSDLVATTTIDPKLTQDTIALGSQAGRTLDTVTREEINGGTNVIFASDMSDKAAPKEIVLREDLKQGCHLSRDAVFSAAAQLKTQNAKKFESGFVAIVHPYSSYDLMSDPEWIDIQKYGHAEKIYEGEIGKLGGVHFIESSEAKVFLPSEIVPGVRRMKIKSGSATSYVVDGEFEGNITTPVEVYVNGVENTVTKIQKGSGTTTVTLGSSATASAGQIICGRNAGKFGDAVFSTLVLGREAYGVTTLAGKGRIEYIFKPLGSSGTADPLNQRCTSGWKANKVAKRLNEQYMVRIESVNKYSPRINDN